jgi:Calcineurin-like phosphoesterase
VSTLQVACIGDTHIQPGHARNADRLAAFDAAIAGGLALPHLAAWVHLGDVYHAQSAPADRLAVANRFIQMAERAPVIVVNGNHGHELDSYMLERLRAAHPISVVSQPSLLHVGGVLFAVLPYPSKATMVAAGATREAQVRVAHDAFDLLALADAGGQIWQAFEGPRMVVGHLTIAGAVTSVGQPLVAAELEMDPMTLQRYGAVPKIFGHIHKHQQINDAVYVGSCCRMDWGETERKGWVQVDFTKTRLHGDVLAVYGGVPWVHQWIFNELPVPPMYHVEGTLTRDSFDWNVRKGQDGPSDHPPAARVPCPDCGGQHPLVNNSLFEDVTVDELPLCRTCNGQGELVDWTGCDVRVRARYAQSERAVLSNVSARIGRMFHGARHLELEMVAVSQRELRAPEVAAAVTLPEKLQAWSRLTGTPWSGEIERCAGQLLSSDDGDAVVNDVQTRLELLAQLRQELVS